MATRTDHREALIGYQFSPPPSGTPSTPFFLPRLSWNGVISACNGTMRLLLRIDEDRMTTGSDYRSTSGTKHSRLNRRPRADSCIKLLSPDLPLLGLGIPITDQSSTQRECNEHTRALATQWKQANRIVRIAFVSGIQAQLLSTSDEEEGEESRSRVLIHLVIKSFDRAPNLEVSSRIGIANNPSW